MVRWALVFPHPFGWFFSLASGSFRSVYMQALVCTQLTTQEGHSVDICSDFCAALSSLVLCTMNCSCPGLFRFSTVAPQLKELDTLHLDSLSLWMWSGPTFKVVRRDNIGFTSFVSHLSGISILRHPTIPCLENHCFICFCLIFPCFKLETKLCPFLHSGQKQEFSLFDFSFWLTLDSLRSE